MSKIKFKYEANVPDCKICEKPILPSEPFGRIRINMESGSVYPRGDGEQIRDIHAFGIYLCKECVHDRTEIVNELILWLNDNYIDCFLHPFLQEFHLDGE